MDFVIDFFLEELFIHQVLLVHFVVKVVVLKSRPVLVVVNFIELLQLFQSNNTLIVNGVLVALALLHFEIKVLLLAAASSLLLVAGLSSLEELLGQLRVLGLLLSGIERLGFPLLAGLARVLACGFVESGENLRRLTHLIAGVTIVIFRDVGLHLGILLFDLLVLLVKGLNAGWVEVAIGLWDG